MSNIFTLTCLQLLAKFISEIALAGTYLMLFKLNVYPQFAISRQLFKLPELSSLNLYLLVSSADYLCKQFGPRSGPAKHRA